MIVRHPHPSPPFKIGSSRFRPKHVTGIQLRKCTDGKGSMHLHYGTLLRVQRFRSEIHLDCVFGRYWTRMTAFASLDGGIGGLQREGNWLENEIAREESRNCAVLPMCFGGCTYKWQEGAPKEVTCTRLRSNARELLSIALTEVEASQQETRSFP